MAIRRRSMSGARGSCLRPAPPAPWLNLVERFFAEISRKRIRRGVVRSVVALQFFIKDHFDQHHTDPKPFARTASAGDIIEKVDRIRNRKR